MLFKGGFLHAMKVTIQACCDQYDSDYNSSLILLLISGCLWRC